MWVVEKVDEILNRVTMYRLVLYVLLTDFLLAIFLGFLGVLSFNPAGLLFSGSVILLTCYLTNRLFARLFSALANVESWVITGLILVLIVTPAQTLPGALNLIIVSIVAMATKYFLAINSKHVFNPAAMAVVLTGMTMGMWASWWVGTGAMFPVVLVGGLLIARKLRRFELVVSFMSCAGLVILGSGWLRGFGEREILSQLFFDSPILFFATIMLPEPQTTPPQRWARVILGLGTGVLFGLPLHFGKFYLLPEMVLVMGNVFSYLLSSKQRLILSLKEKRQLAPDLWEFVFNSPSRPTYKPGQFMEWTVSDGNSDSRGNRRFFTLASSPTEKELRIGIKVSADGSSFKRKLLTMGEGEKISASQVAGGFTLQNDKGKKYVFLAGGIGVTPFRSMVKYLLDVGESRDIVLVYAEKAEEELAYRDVFDQAAKKMAMKNVYVLSGERGMTSGWKGELGYINGAMLAEHIPDFRERLFYVSGPHALVVSLEKELRKLGIREKSIVTDYFSGYA